MTIEEKKAKIIVFMCKKILIITMNLQIKDSRLTGKTEIDIIYSLFSTKKTPNNIRIHNWNA